MKNDFLKDLKFLGVTARLKRLSDTLSISIKELYRANNVDLEPSWHLVLIFLKDRTATLSETASSLHLSQPAMTKMATRMAAKGYLEIVRDEADSRKKNICLSAKARQCLPAFERIWAAGQEAVREVVGANTVLLDYIEELEDQLAAKSFKTRAQEHLDRACPSL